MLNVRATDVDSGATHKLSPLPNPRHLSRQDLAWMAAREAVEAAGAPPVPTLSHATLSQLRCPLSKQPIEQPVVAADGHTYERSAIEAWVSSQLAARQQPCSPITGQPLAHTQLCPNHFMRSVLADGEAAALW